MAHSLCSRHTQLLNFLPTLYTARLRQDSHPIVDTHGGTLFVDRRKRNTSDKEVGRKGGRREGKKEADIAAVEMNRVFTGHVAE